MARFLLGSLVLLVTLPAAATAADLSRYRSFQLGTSLPAIARQAALEPSAAKTIHRRPALIQELQWHPRPLGPSSRTEAVDAVTFSFYDGSLFRIAVQYGRYETEGMTANDFVEAISATYGPAVRPAANVTSNHGPYGDAGRSPGAMGRSRVPLGAHQLVVRTQLQAGWPGEHSGHAGSRPPTWNPGGSTTWKLRSAMRPALRVKKNPPKPNSKRPGW